MSRHQFRFLVVLNQLLILASVIVYELTESSIPPEIRAYFSFDQSVLDTEITNITPLTDVPYWLGTLSILMGFVASIGLCLGQRWGRSLYVITFLTAVLMTTLTEFYVSTGWSAFVGYFASTTEGMILALIYFSPIKRMFGKNESEGKT